jgi:FkbM family methyltransferase
LNEVHFDSFPESRTDGIENPILVKVNTLDNFIQSIQIKYDCLLKIDVQGFEKKV